MNFFRFPPKKQTFGTWEPGPLPRLRHVCPESIREFKTEKQNMYLNRLTLIGFLGSDAEVRTANNSTFTLLSLATKSSYKDKKTGEYVSHTEWHRAIAWGKLAECAKSLTKGSHLQIEGELRSREYEDKKNGNAKRRVWEVRVDSILKLGRAEKASAADASAVPAPEEVPF